MFTGIIQKLGNVVTISRNSSGATLSVNIGELATDVKLGDSVAINGACLSATRKSGQIVDFDVVAETLSRTNIGSLKSGEWVNVELALKASDRIDGHFVLGHIDTTAHIIAIDDLAMGKNITFQLNDTEYIRYIIPKGSIAIDGISLTIANVSVPDKSFSIAIIPTTLENTNLKYRSIGSSVNVETDILAKTIIHNLANSLSQQNHKSNPDENLNNLLKKAGFL